MALLESGGLQSPPAPLAGMPMVKIFFLIVCIVLIQMTALKSRCCAGEFSDVRMCVISGDDRNITQVYIAGERII